MIEIHNNFLSDVESQELIDLYIDNKQSEFFEKNDIYSFKGINIENYNTLAIAKKVDLSNAKPLRVQLIDRDIKVVEDFHQHRIPWTYLIFLNDNFTGGELVIENFLVKPRKNQLIIFSGALPHKVQSVTFGSRYTFICFSASKVKLNNRLI